MIIALPKEIVQGLSALADKEGRKLKPYVERIIIKHVERKLNKQ